MFRKVSELSRRWVSMIRHERPSEEDHRRSFARNLTLVGLLLVTIATLAGDAGLGAQTAVPSKNVAVERARALVTSVAPGHAIGNLDVRVSARLAFHEQQPGKVTATVEAGVSLDDRERYGGGPKQGHRFRITVALPKPDGGAFTQQAESVPLELNWYPGVLYRANFTAPQGTDRVAVVLEDLENGRWGGEVARIEPASVRFPPDFGYHVLQTHEATAEEAVGGAGKGRFIALIPPHRPGLSGHVRLQTVAATSVVDRVDFLLDGRPVAHDDHPPFSARIDLGSRVAKHTVTAVALDKKGDELGRDTRTLNEATPTFSVDITAPATGSGALLAGRTETAVRVTAPPGARVRKVELFLGKQPLLTLESPPWEGAIELPSQPRQEVLRAIATLLDGRTSEDARILNAPGFSASTSVDLIELPLFVTDVWGHWVTDLGTGDFVVRQGGATYPIASVGTSAALGHPLSWAVVADLSDSVARRLPDMQESLSRFFDRVTRNGSRALLVAVRGHPQVVQTLTSDRSLLDRATQDLSSGGATGLYDGLFLALVQLAPVPGPKAILILTDGGDNASRAGAVATLQTAEELSIPCYIAQLGALGRGPGYQGDWNRAQLGPAIQQLARQTGGAWLHGETARSLDNAVAKAVELARREYWLSYYRPRGNDEPAEIRLTGHHFHTTVRIVGLQ